MVEIFDNELLKELEANGISKGKLFSNDDLDKPPQQLSALLQKLQFEKAFCQQKKNRFLVLEEETFAATKELEEYLQALDFLAGCGETRFVCDYPVAELLSVKGSFLPKEALFVRGLGNQFVKCTLGQLKEDVQKRLQQAKEESKMLNNSIVLMTKEILLREVNLAQLADTYKRKAV